MESVPNTPMEALAPELRTDVSRMIFKLSQLGFLGSFSRMEEGPILRTFYLQPQLTAIFSKVLNRDEEIAGVLSVESARLYRSGGLLAVEIPRPDRQTIRFDQCLNQMMLSPLTKEMALPLLMGQNPKGEYLYADLSVQPHLLIAGTTGSGKSIYTSQLICSLALFRDPSELKFILVDTKNLDLVLFRGLEHIQNVLTNVNDLRSYLIDVLKEVRRRTQIMSGTARNIKEWNTLHPDAKLDYWVLIIDELADVMELDAAYRSGMDKDEKADNPAISAILKQITQISRAAGIHVIMATQRPSVGMITGDARIKFGDIKANFPARVCFKLPTMVDSRVVLDENGAEILLGKGDYLYKLSDIDTAQRAHSAFVSMNDIGLILTQHNEIRRMYAEQLMQAGT